MRGATKLTWRAFSVRTCALLCGFERPPAASSGLHGTPQDIFGRSRNRKGGRPGAILPMTKEAAPTLLARRLGMGRGGFGTAEWRRHDASGGGRQSAAAWRRVLLCRLGDLVGCADEHVPTGTIVGDRDERQTSAPVTRDGDTGGFSPLVNKGVLTVLGGLIPRLEANDRHCCCLS